MLSHRLLRKCGQFVLVFALLGLTSACDRLIITDTADESNAVGTVYGGDGQLRLQWSAVNGADKYKVYYSEESAFSVATATLLNDSVGSISGTSAAVLGLSNGTTYYVWVAAVTDGVEGELMPLGSATPVAGIFDVVVSDLVPPINAVEVNPASPVRIPFNAALAPSTVDLNTVSVTVGGVLQAVSISLVNSGLSIEISPSSGSWLAGSDYYITVSSDVQSQTGESLGEGFGFGFSTLDTASLIAWYEFDNALTDLSGEGNHIDFNSGVSFSDAEHVSGSHSAYFDGASFLRLSDAAFELGDQFSVTTWIYLPLLQADINTILANTTPTETVSGFKIGVNSYQQLDNRVILEAGNGSAGGKVISDAGFVQDGQWYHFAYNVDIVDLLPSGEHVQIFFDGAEADVTLTSADDSINTMDWSQMKTSGPLYFGAMAHGTQFFLNGAYLDDMRIYNRPLTADEVLNIAR